jgi:hypothetical protein
MKEKITRFLKHYLRLRAAHPLVALFLLICLSGTAVGAANCTETCTLSMLATEHQASVSIDGACCGAGSGGERMACCEPAKSDNDKVAGSELKLSLRNFAPVLPTVVSAPEFSAATAALVKAGSFDRHATSAAQPQKLYILNRSLLI